MDVGIIRGNAISYLLEDCGLAGFGRRDDQTALAAADGRQQIDKACAINIVPCFQAELLKGKNRGQALIDGPLFGLLWIEAVDCFNT